MKKFKSKLKKLKKNVKIWKKSQLLQQDQNMQLDVEMILKKKVVEIETMKMEMKLLKKLKKIMEKPKIRIFE